jgi:hypothetical protein
MWNSFATSNTGKKNAYISYSPQEPTVEDMCGTGGHGITDYIDPMTGWFICHCGMVTAPVGGDEPHDEYTAAVANLIESYVELLSKAFDGDNSSYRNIRKSELRILANKVLGSSSPRRLQALFESLQNTNPDLFGELARIDEQLIDHYIALGTHLDYQGRKVVTSVVLSAPVDMSERDALDGEISEDNVGLARTAARLHSLMDGDNRESFAYRDMEKQFIAICPVLENRQELIPTAAFLYNTRGCSDATTDQIIEIVAKGDEPVRAAIAEGLL